jgi:hypothetical protein
VTTPFDATSKALVELAPADWLTFLGQPRPPEAVTAIDADLATVSVSADKVLRVADPEPWLVHLEFQAARDGELPRRVQAYNVLLQQRHRLPVYSLVILLARAANSPSLDGTLRTAPPLGPAWEFRYDVLRVWELPPDRLLTGPVALVPLAPLAAVTPAGVPALARRAEARVAALGPPAADVLWTSLLNLLDLRREEPGMADILQGLKLPARTRTLEEWFEMTRKDLKAEVIESLRKDLEPEIREGVAAEVRQEVAAEVRQEVAAEVNLARARADVIRLGTQKFGRPSPAQQAAIQNMLDLPRLEQLLGRVLDTNSWDELLQP